MKIRLFAMASVVVSLHFVEAALSQALDTEAHRACLAMPDTACLLDLAQLERDEFWSLSPEDAGFGQNNWLGNMVRFEAENGELDRAATHLLQLDPEDLRSFVVYEYDAYPELKENIIAEGKIRGALESRVSSATESFETASAVLELQANTAWTLFRLGYESLATDILTEATDKMVVALEAGNTEVVNAASILVEAAIQTDSSDLVERLVEAISQPEMAEKGYSDEWKFWTNEYALGIIEQAEARRGIAEDPANDLFEAALAEALNGDMGKALEYVRDLPLGNEYSSRFTQIQLLVGRLLEADRPDRAVLVAAEEASDWDRDNLMVSIARYFLVHGQAEQAEALLNQMTNSGARAGVLIRLALDKAVQGEDETARSLLDRGVVALAQELDPTRQTFLNIDVGSVYAELGNSAAAREAVDSGLNTISGIRDASFPGQQDFMLQFEAAKNAATVLAILGDGMEALAPIKRQVGESPSDQAVGAFETAKALASRGRADLAEDMVGETLRSMQNSPGIDHEVWSYLYLLAAGALPSPS